MEKWGAKEEIRQKKTGNESRAASEGQGKRGDEKGHSPETDFIWKYICVLILKIAQFSFINSFMHRILGSTRWRWSRAEEGKCTCMMYSEWLMGWSRKTWGRSEGTGMGPQGRKGARLAASTTTVTWGIADSRDICAYTAFELLNV